MAAPAVATRVSVRAVKMRVFASLCVYFIITYKPVITESFNKSCGKLYSDGVEAYLDERWQDCIDNFEHAISSYHSLKESVVSCRVKCQMAVDELPFMSPNNIENLNFFEKMVRKTLCLLKCNDLNAKNIHNILTKDVEKNFEGMKPYEYLHLCYFQKNMFQKAASAAFTFLAGNPNNEMMKENLKFYSNLPEVDMNDVTNVEAKKFVSLYIHGMEAYDQQDYRAVISYFEESLEDYLREEDKCRAFCEGPFDQGWFPDFVSSIANHFTYCLKCKRQCPKKLNSLNGEEHVDLLPSHYHFLQFSYYKVGNLKKACEAVASYLLFYPADETMLTNKEYYLKLPKVNNEYFTPREEALKYVQRQEYEIQLLNYIGDEFVFQDVGGFEKKKNNETRYSTVKKTGDIMAPVTNLKLLPPPIIKFEWPKYDKIDNIGDRKKHEVEMMKDTRWMVMKHSLHTGEELKRRKKRAVEQIQKASGRNIQVIMGEKELKGKYRFVAEGFANKSECNKLMELAQVAAVQGDGYHGNKSPHTDYEKFEGVTLGRVALLVYFGLIEVEILDIYLKLSEMGRDYLERYFNLKTELYFTYTHLVCRSALAGSPSNRSDMSHAIHADNCNLHENGECSKKPPAYTWRDYSAILYLNDDFEGGEFIFATDITAQNIESTVKPRCGRLVGFSAGSENLHGVQGVHRGRRCAIGLWFTFNPIYEEIEYILAKEVLQQVLKDGSVTDQLIKELRKYVVFHESTSSSFHKPGDSSDSPLSVTSEEQLNHQERYVKGPISHQESLAEIVTHRDTSKIQVERHK